MDIKNTKDNSKNNAKQKVVAYCRVSTEKNEQLESLEMQEKFFKEYCILHNYELVKIYSDKGKSGTKTKNRTELLKLIDDSKFKLFSVVLIKDYSRLSRNVVDFFTTMQSLEKNDVKTVFVNSDMTSESSTLILAVSGAMAQEESANISKKVKFGKDFNAKLGRVPNMCFGYDKIKGDLFNLNINYLESKTVIEIFDLYTKEKLGLNKIAKHLNEKNIKTKRNSTWSSGSISRILRNEIYIGKVVNKKTYVENFLTGKRCENESLDWCVVENDSLKIVKSSTFLQAQKLLEDEKRAFGTGKKYETVNVFSGLIKCSCCGKSYRKKTKVSDKSTVWLCSHRDRNGVSYCDNSSIVPEDFLIEEIKKYFLHILESKEQILKDAIKEFKKAHKADDAMLEIKQLKNEIKKLNNKKDNYFELFADGIMSKSEISDKVKSLNTDIDILNSELEKFECTESALDFFVIDTKKVLNDINKIFDNDKVFNDAIRTVVDSISIDEKGNIEVLIKFLTENRIIKPVTLCNVSTDGSNIKGFVLHHEKVIANGFNLNFKLVFKID